MRAIVRCHRKREDSNLTTADPARVNKSRTHIQRGRSVRSKIYAIGGLLTLAALVSGVGAYAQETVVIGGSGLPAVEINLETALAPTASGLRSARRGRGERGLLPDERPPLVDISTFSPSLLPKTVRPSRRAESAASAPQPPAQATAKPPMTDRKPRVGTRIPAVSLAAEVGPKDGLSTQTAALSKPVPATPPPTKPAPAAPPATPLGKPKPPAEAAPAAKIPPAPPPPAVKAKPLVTAAPPSTQPKPAAPIKAPALAPSTAKSTAESTAKNERSVAPPSVPQLPKQTTVAKTQPRSAAPPPPPPVAAPALPKSTTATRKAATETKVAAAPSPKAVSPKANSPGARNGVLTRLVFPAGNADVSGPLAEQLDAVAQAMRTRDERLLLQAYAAAGQSGGNSGSRRLSLARALEVRSYLIRKGLKSTRIDVRALGTSDTSGPTDRVDIILLSR